MSRGSIIGRGAWLARLARKLILDVRQGEGRQHADLAVLTELATHAPAIAAELLLEVARHVDDSVIARIVADAPSDGLEELIAREAHRVRDRGDRSQWVMWGEGRYQRLKSRRRRLRVS